MATSFRQFSGTPVSFFSFIDIITGVSGVLILITLLLTTMITPTTEQEYWSSDDEDKKLKATLDKTLDELARLSAENRRLQTLLVQSDQIPNKDAVREELDDLSAQVRQLQHRIASAHGKLLQLQEQLARRDEQLGLNALIRQIESLQEEIRALQQKAKELLRQIPQLEATVKAAQERLLKVMSEKNRLWVIPEPTRTTKEPLLVIVSKHLVSIDRFDKPDERLSLSAPYSARQFKDKLKAYNSVNHYIVFFVRPSGVAAFEALRNEAKQIGFEVGYDALEEDTEIIFSRTDKGQP
jgi:cell division septum initiation protein DivIVA